jgi:hypothetical protein
MPNRDALRDHALRIHRRYAIEVVEAFGFCPWASAARTGGRVRTQIVFGTDCDPMAVAQQVLALEDDAGADIGLLVFPELTLGRVAFQRFGARVRAAYEPPGSRRAHGFALADFHPDAEAELDAPERLVPFIRRSPDPTLQLIRYSALDAARLGSPGSRFMDPSALAALERGALPPRVEPVHERLARANLETVQRLGVAHVTAVIEDILRDRDASYAECAVPTPPWRHARSASTKM